MKYPTRRNGLIVPPAELGFAVPTIEQIGTRGLVNIHHGYFPRFRFDYVRYVGVFRNLVDNTFQMIQTEHNQGQRTLHTQFRDGVPKPSEALMVEIVEDHLFMNGSITCVRENHTSSTYVIEQPEWRHIKKGYKSGKH